MEHLAFVFELPKLEPTWCCGEQGQQIQHQWKVHLEIIVQTLSKAKCTEHFSE